MPVLQFLAAHFYGRRTGVLSAILLRRLEGSPAWRP